MNIIVSIPNVCNLNCPYCYSRPVASKELIDVDMWTKGLLNVPGWPHVWTFGYGEPTADPGCVEIALKLLERGDKVAFLSNLTNNIEKLKSIPNNYKSNFSFSSSYHPHYWDVDSFIKVAQEYRSYGFKCDLVQILAYPPYIHHLKKWKSKLEEAGFLVWVIVFVGFYNQKAYPESYTEEEKEIVCQIVEGSCPTKFSFGEIQAKLVSGEKKIKRCRVGMDFLTINNKGIVYSCYQLKDKGILGNIIDGVEPLAEPIFCDQEFCQCYGMWKYIVKEDQ